ncbi:fatty acid desaturase family protein [Paraburkholderia sp. J11-2]|uniref:fatty acid desaturase family protein n=1 Tax=Paraburkholderia sp. J11-2 TaxID=2805431 RepID=UPI002AB5EE81|nr:fatty acid desaturase [Paraburkholderia sp. J11-2]
MWTTPTASVIADQVILQSTLRENFPAVTASTWRSVRDIVLDWGIIGLAVWATYRIGLWAMPLSIIVIGNRQRALGNLLHEASHQNLSPWRHINDVLAGILLAAPLFNSLAFYRRQHAKHHAWLGDAVHDPDVIACTVADDDHWLNVYSHVLFAYPVWEGSLLGHLTGRRLAWRQWSAIVFWWILFEILIAIFLGIHMAWLSLVLWIVAKGTIFHAITVFREMTDHYGLKPVGIFQYTREIPTHGLLSVLLHPHHNGYHLTHHLFPHIPYYRLPHVHAYLIQNSLFIQRAIICHTYLNGTHAGVDGWGANHA